MKKKARGNQPNRSWRGIRQTANRKVVTAHARRRILRNVFRGFLAAGTVAVVGAAVYFGVGYWQQGIQKVSTVLPAQPLREITFTTDGVLSEAWLEERLALPEEIDIMDIDIQQKKLLLEASGQVKSAVIRRLPDRLVIDVQERSPVLRLGTREGVLLVDREGYVYRGRDYDRHELTTFPYLAGVSLKRQGDGFRRLSGIDRIADLLETARSNGPHLYRSWRVVDYGEAPLIKIQSDEIREIVFAPDRYMEQLRLLDMIIESNRRQLAGMQERADLSLDNQVVVR